MLVGRTALSVDTSTKRRVRFLALFTAYFVAVWLLWNTPVVYPLKLFVVLLHEISHGLAAIATKIGGTAILGDNYEFYHGATLGGGDQNSLRGYRNERFNGKYAFFQNIDIRSAIARFRTDFIPMAIGASAGFDYGRVWVEDDNSSQWHTDVGGSIFINAFRAFTGNLGYYVGDEGGRFNFSFNFEF